MHRFTSERLFIRLLEEQDNTFYCNLLNDKKVMRHTGGAMSVKEAEKAFLRSLNANNAIAQHKTFSILTWVILSKESNQLIGIQSLSTLNRPYHIKAHKEAKSTGKPQAEIGIVLTLEANGKLYPEEAMGALIEYAFTQLPIEKINAYFSVSNLATARFTKKLGFIRQKGTQPQNQVTESINKKNWRGHNITLINQ